MTQALVICESMFGNTRAVADAVASGLRSAAAAVEVVDVKDAPEELPAGLDLLVVGGPTHAFSMTRASTRQSAEEQGAPPEVAEGKGIREWIAEVHPRKGLATVTFDTKVNKPHLPGSAAHAAERRLRHKGFTSLEHGESFYVTGTTGDLVEGELERARQWGEELAASTQQAAFH